MAGTETRKLSNTYFDMGAQSQNSGKREAHCYVTTRLTRDGAIKRAFVTMQRSVTIAQSQQQLRSQQ
jgi:hypothetical protein